MPFKKGESGNPRGKRPMDPIIRFNLKMAARAHCEKALEVIARCLQSDDKRIALMAAGILLDRGFGKPEQQTDVEANHRFVIAPQVMPLDKWLANKGQPEPTPVIDLDPSTDDDDPDRKLN